MTEARTTTHFVAVWCSLGVGAKLGGNLLRLRSGQPADPVHASEIEGGRADLDQFTTVLHGLVRLDPVH